MSGKSHLKIDMTNFINYAKNPYRFWTKIHHKIHWFTNDLAKNSVIMKLKLKKKIDSTTGPSQLYEIVFTMFFKQNKQHSTNISGKWARWPHEI